MRRKIMEKMKMLSENLVDENVEKIAKLFPNCITEGKDEDGKVVRAVDFDLLKQELSKDLVEGNDERYTLNWAGKKQSILTANSPINATLRPCKEESVGKDGTPGGWDSQNLYIEGDNLDVLKLLRETYLNKIKMIYIDPPYNTGNDFVYNDDFASSADEYLQNSKSYDEDGNRMVQNLESNGRFHSDWLSMMYPRLKLARDLLTDDGVIFISIDDNEQVNLKKICDEIFGVNNFVNLIVVESASTGGLKRTFKDSRYLKTKEYLLVYSKSTSIELKPLYTVDNILDSHYSLWFDGINYMPLKKKVFDTFNTKTPQNLWLYDPQIKKFLIDNANFVYRLNGHEPPSWIYNENSKWEKVFENSELELYKVTGSENKIEYIRKDKNGKAKETNIFSLALKVETINDNKEICTLRGDLWKDFHKDMGNVTKEGEIIYPNGKKPLRMITDIIESISQENDIIMDFFSGSGTTAHAVMSVNKNKNSTRKFILVQIPEIIDYTNKDNIKNYQKYGFKTICDLGKERIRRAGQKIAMDLAGQELTNRQQEIIDALNSNPDTIQAINNMRDKKIGKNSGKCPIDIGFRVLKLDSSNMKDVYYTPAETPQASLLDLVSNIKEDRSPEDLLFQVMLDMGVMLDSKIEKIELSASKQAFNVNDGNLICCFDINLSEEDVTKIAKLEPLYAVFRDSSMSSDSVAVNFDQIFETYSPSTTRKVL